MSDTIKILKKVKIAEDGLFDVNAIYGAIMDWLGSNDYDVGEDKNLTKHTPNGAEIKMKFYAERNLDGYYRIMFDIKIFANHVKKVKVNGQELDRGHIEVIINNALVKDYRNRFDKGPFKKFLQHFYDNYLKKKKQEAYEDKADAEGKMLVCAVKEAFNFYKTP